MRARFPLTEEHLTNLKNMFQKYDIDKSGSIEMNEMEIMLNDIDKKLTHLPAVSWNMCRNECISNLGNDRRLKWQVNKDGI